ncbi:hypothetical protein NDU88_002812 [Pleurodeles waltl]|uniref:Uncharacterized protein n=1 Tax=Pleurodeles waltl TaxID=8319 RepID=A0AAV7VEC2_PLEWA|nr:hypothetical protein NDU88_002812 [Pleurodeles waltl]
MKVQNGCLWMEEAEDCATAKGARNFSFEKKMSHSVLEDAELFPWQNTTKKPCQVQEWRLKKKGAAQAQEGLGCRHLEEEAEGAISNVESPHTRSFAGVLVQSAVDPWQKSKREVQRNSGEFLQVVMFAGVLEQSAVDPWQKSKREALILTLAGGGGRPPKSRRQVTVPRSKDRGGNSDFPAGLAGGLVQTASQPSGKDASTMKPARNRAGGVEAVRRVQLHPSRISLSAQQTVKYM